MQTDEPIKVGGQALADGVLMRSPRAWAIARADGTVEVGTVAPNPFARIPVLRIVAALFAALKLGVGRGLLGRGRDGGRRGSSRLNRRLLVILVVLEAAAFAATRAAGDMAASPAAVAVTTVVTFAVLRLATPKSLWRYHGAEHKAVAAHEQGIDLTDVRSVLQAPRVHDRCGTNLVFIVLVAGYGLHNAVHGLWQVPAFLALIGAAAEVATVAAKRPHSLPSRILLGGGKALQRWVTTAEPTAAEQRVGCVALAACLEEHARIVAVETDETAPAMAAVGIAAA